MNLLVLLLSSLLLGTLIAAFFLFTQRNNAHGPVAGFTAPLAPARPTVLLLGPTNSGKTALFNTLSATASDNDKTTTIKPTYTSQDYNVTDYRPTITGAKLRLVDVPGHPKVHNAALEAAGRREGRMKVRGVVFVIDAATLEKAAASVARELVDAVAVARKKDDNVPVLVCGNKMDLFTAVDAHQVKTVLEKEIQAFSVSRTRNTRIEGMSERDDGVAAGSDDGGPDAWLLDADSSTPFTFDAHDIQVCEASVVKGDVSAIQDFISNVV